MSTRECSALNNAIKGQGLSYSQIAQRINTSEQRVTAICTGQDRPTTKEFNDLTSTLGITKAAPNDAAHATK